MRHYAKRRSRAISRTCVVVGPRIPFFSLSFFSFLQPFPLSRAPFRRSSSPLPIVGFPGVFVVWSRALGRSFFPPHHSPHCGTSGTRARHSCVPKSLSFPTFYFLNSTNIKNLRDMCTRDTNTRTHAYTNSSDSLMALVKKFLRLWRFFLIRCAPPAVSRRGVLYVTSQKTIPEM